MKIVIPTNDRKSIAQRTGRASEFAFYTINNAEIKSVTYTKNIHSHNDHDRKEGHHHGENETHEHEHEGHNHEHGEHNHDELLEILVDIDLLLVRAVGKYMRKTLQKGNIKYELVRVDDISEILKKYL